MDFPPVYGMLNKNQLWRAHENQEGDDTDIYRLPSRYTFLAKNTMSVSIQTCQTKVYRVFYASLRYIERKPTIEGAQKPRGDTDIPFTVTVYLFLAKQTRSFFILTWFFTTCVFTSSYKNPEQRIRRLSRVIRSRTTYMTTYVLRSTHHSKKQPTNNAEHTRHNTADKQHKAHVTDPNNAQPPRHGVIRSCLDSL